MIGQTHRMGGIALGSLAATGLLLAGKDINIVGCAVLVAGSAVGSLVPDIDHKGSMIGKKLPHISALVSSQVNHRGVVHSLLGLFVFSLMTSSLGYLLSSYDSELKLLIALISTLICVSAIDFGLKLLFRLAHRRLSNKKLKQINLVVAILCVVLSLKATSTITYFIPFYIIGLSVGYLSHLLLDTLNPLGVNYFYPGRLYISIAKIVTGSETETLVLLACTIVAVVSSITFLVNIIM